MVLKSTYDARYCLTEKYLLYMFMDLLRVSVLRKTIYSIRLRGYEVMHKICLDWKTLFILTDLYDFFYIILNTPYHEI